MSARRFGWVVAAVLVAGGRGAAAQAPADGPPPSKREQEKLVEEYLALDPREAADLARRLEILRRLDAVSLDQKRRVKSWTRFLDRRWAKGPRLEAKRGRHFWWEDEERGLYYVGGETKRPKGLLVGMHGGGVGMGDASTSFQAMDAAARARGWVAVFPEVLEKTERGWTDSGTEEWALDLVDAALRTWDDVDPDRVYFAGHSMGGYGAWVLGAHHADRVAGLAASAGAPTPVYGPDGTIVEIQSGVVPNLRNTRLVVYQSADDPRVPPDANRAAVAEVEKARARWGGFDGFAYLEVDGRGHDYPEGGFAALFDRIADARRDPVPDHLVWQPSLPWKRQFAWLWWPRPKLGAVVEAELDREANAVRLRSDADLSGMEVLLDDRVLDLDRPVVVTVNGEETLRREAVPTLGTLLLTHHGRDTGRRFLARLPVRP